MGKIKYDFYTNPNAKSENSKSEYHIRVCGQQTISTKGIIELIHNASTLTPADINAVIFAFQEEIANQLAKGNIVKLEGLCSFNISLKSVNGTCTGNENGKGIELKSVNINPEKEFTEMVKDLVAKNGMEKVMARHSVSVSDEKVDAILTNYFSTNKAITRPKLQDICSTTRYMAMRQIKRLTESGKLVNIGFENHPLYMPTPGSFGTKEKGTND
ncbi:HU family DNA-binding protein [Bacteroides caecigallinarum]|uniref:HU family DNA-binding protein n=1 Tax=Bacteroides caecigallinarum TaxID=1411144 RepID=UPI00195627A2|nr:HU family DNA-binding protein [Bacteroides caecigallinarum]MBM6881755.1 HU family DNA-binding protein [Bacteroides caecigallinarum]MDN0072655.1 HU family DNA-binding protein [Bacteroides caecigallinarum]